MNIEKKIAEELGIKVTQVEAAVKLIDEGCNSFYCKIQKGSYRSVK